MELSKYIVKEDNRIYFEGNEYLSHTIVYGVDSSGFLHGVGEYLSHGKKEGSVLYKPTYKEFIEYYKFIDKLRDNR